MIMQKCRRHPLARFYRDCPGCKQDLADTQARNERATAARRIVTQIAALVPGTIQSVNPVDTGAVIVCHTPASEWGEYEVMAWRPRTEWEIAQDAAECPAGAEIPRVAYVAAHTVQSTEEIDAVVADVTAYLTARLGELAAA